MDEIWSYGQMAAWLDEKTSQKLQWLATIVVMNGFFWSSGFYVLFETDFNVPLLKHTFIFFQPPARFTPGNATSDTTRICDANAPEGKAAILVIVRYLWSSRERCWAPTKPQWFIPHYSVHAWRKEGCSTFVWHAVPIIIINSLFSRIIPRTNIY